jgi:hypothetical protein
MLKLRDGTRNIWQVSITYTDLHKTNTYWLVHNWSTFGVRTSHMQLRTHKTHHNPDLGEATTFPLIVYYAPLHRGHIQMVFFVPRLPNGSFEIPLARILATLRAHNLACKPLIAMSLNQSCSPCQKVFNNMSHTACTQGNQINS